MAKRPTDEEFRQAIDWLEKTDDGPLRDACCKVSVWLEARIASDLVGKVAREAGCTRRYARLMIERRI